jgi:hypothetical protein
MPMPALRKISETIIEFGEPLINQLDADQPEEVVRSTFEIVITVWNAHVMAMPRWEQPRFIVDLQERLRDPQMTAPWSTPFASFRVDELSSLPTTRAPSASGRRHALRPLAVALRCAGADTAVRPMTLRSVRRPKSPKVTFSPCFDPCRQLARQPASPRSCRRPGARSNWR